MAYAKVIRDTKIFELENFGKFLYKVKCNWGNKRARLVQIEKKKHCSMQTEIKTIYYT